ncbi:MAG: YitT family protein [Prevotella sp.]|nr:YitT family protein [Prevotella sp.]
MLHVLKNKNIEREVKDYLFITFGLVLFAFGWTVFLLPYQIVTGGVTGIAAIIYYATGIEIEISYFIINAILLAIGLRILGWRFLMKTIYAIFMISFLLWLFQELIKSPDGEIVKILGEGQAFMSLIVGCTFTGSSLAIVFYNNGSTGGTDIIAASVNKYYNLSLGQVLIIVDLIIIGSCFFIPQFGDGIDRIHKVAFGLCTMVVENFVLDYVNNSMRQSVQFMIFSKKHAEIAHAIGTEMDHGVTILDGHGWYTGQEMKVLCILARKRESPQMFRIIKSIDPNAFVSVGSVIGVYGEGFDPIKAKVPNKIENNEDSIRNE